MPNREFLERYPLYRKFTINLPGASKPIEAPSIHMYCPVCKSDQTFNLYGGKYTSPFIDVPPEGVDAITYCCASCEKFKRYFLLKFDPQGKYIMKVGQEPPWEITPDRTLEKTLGAHAEYYKKGLVCESQSYGIGAFAYYRRIVEEVIDDLLAAIPDLMGGEERERYIQALEQTKKTTVTQDKIDLVKDLLPSILRPSGMNPLATLHGVLSEGLHSESDEHCIELAMGIREVLVFLVNQIAISQAAAAGFTESMRKLLERRSKGAA
jgi:hypothetical protein